MNKQQLEKFIRLALPPLLKKFALPLLRMAWALPAVRIVALIVIGGAIAFVLVPAAIVGLLVWLVSDNATTALVVSFLMAAVAGLVLAKLFWILHKKWRVFKRQHLAK